MKLKAKPIPMFIFSKNVGSSLPLQKRQEEPTTAVTAGSTVSHEAQKQ